MKKSILFIMAAAALAGCTTDDNDATNQGISNTRPNFEPRAGSQDAQPQTQYSWDAEAKKAAESTDLTAPNDPHRGRVTEVAPDYGLFSYLSADKPAVGTTLLFSKERKGIRIRVKEIDGDAIIAEVLPGQADIPVLVAGDEFSISADPIGLTPVTSAGEPAAAEPAAE